MVRLFQKNIGSSYAFFRSCYNYFYIRFASMHSSNGTVCFADVKTYIHALLLGCCHSTFFRTSNCLKWEFEAALWSNYVFEKKNFIRTPIWLERLLLSNLLEKSSCSSHAGVLKNFFFQKVAITMVTNAFSAQLPLEDKYFLSKAIAEAIGKTSSEQIIIQNLCFFKTRNFPEKQLFQKCKLFQKRVFLKNRYFFWKDSSAQLRNIVIFIWSKSFLFSSRNFIPTRCNLVSKLWHLVLVKFL